MDSRLYPQGKGAVQAKYVNDVLVEPGLPKQLRVRLTIAQINAGVTILPALPGYGYRLTDWALIAYGGAVATATGMYIKGTQGASVVNLADARTAGLTQSTLLRAGTATNGLILADGASFAKCDNNAAVTVIKNGSDLATATGVDVLVNYVVE